MIERDPLLAKKLTKTGLSNKESAVYAALLQSGGAFPSKVAEATKLNRTTVYKILENLSVRGLVTELQKKRKLFYQVENPRNVERFAQSQVTIARRRLETTRTLLPTLEGLFANVVNKPVVRYFEGKDGVLSVYNDHIAVSKPYEMLAFSNTASLLTFLSGTFKMNYLNQKARLGITTRAVLPDTEVDMRYIETIYAAFPKKILPKVKHVPRTLFPYDSDITIYADNKVSIINFSGPQFVGTIIEDKTIHDMMKMIFELAWAGVDSTARINSKKKSTQSAH
jgi:predicted DNA-binding transcriptional regulator